MSTSLNKKSDRVRRPAAETTRVVTPAAKSKNIAVKKSSSDVIERPQMGVALALLKYFYWIEIGIRSYLRSRENVEFSRAEGLLIATVMLGHNKPSEMARQLGCSRQAVHAMIREMRGKGIVDLVPDAHDGRIKLVVLTPLAQRMNADGIIAMERLWDELGRRVGRPDLNRLAKILAKDWGPPVVFDAEGEGIDG